MALLRVFLLLLAAPPAFAALSFAGLPAQPPENVSAIAVDPANGDVYVSGLTTVIRSTDHGATWTRLGSVHVLGINTLYISQAGKLYAGVDQSFSTPAAGVVGYDA